MSVLHLAITIFCTTQNRIISSNTYDVPKMLICRVLALEFNNISSHIQNSINGTFKGYELIIMLIVLQLELANFSN